MEEKKFSFNIDKDRKEPVLIEVREGNAATLNEPKQYKNDQLTLAAIDEFVSKGFYIDKPWEGKDESKNTTIILFSEDPDLAFVKLMDDPNNPLATILEAKLIVNPDFLSFGINKDKQFDQKGLEKHVRKYAHCFADVEVAKTLLTNLRNFEVRYEQQVTKEDNRQGNKKDFYEEAIKFAKGELPKILKLRLPLFKNTEPVDVEIEVEVDKQSHSNLPLFSFYSMDVELKLREQAKALISALIGKLKGKFPCLEVQ